MTTLPEVNGGPKRRLLPLGTGSILMGDGRSAAGYLLECDTTRVLIDPGPGSLLRLSQAGLGVADLDFVLLSHFHPDHHADLLGLLFRRNNPAFAGGRLRIVAPPGLRAILAAWKTVYGTWIEHADDDIVEVTAGASVALGSIRVHAFPAKHAMPALLYRFGFPDGATAAYSGDTDACDALVEACSGVDFCWVECSFPDELAVAGHMTPGRVHDLLTVAQPRRCGLTHFYPAMIEWLACADNLARTFAELATEVVALRDLEGQPF